MTLSELQALINSRPPGDALISARQICELAGFGETCFYTKVSRDPAFPDPIAFRHAAGRRSQVRWWRSEVLAYFERNRVKRDHDPPP